MTEDGRPYLFSKDYQVEVLATKLITLLREIPHNPNTTLEKRLIEASYLYLEMNLYKNKLMIFDRPIVLGHGETEEERVRYWFNEAIQSILKATGNNDKELNLKFVEEKSNGKGLTRYKTAGGDFVLKGILSPTIMFLSRPDYLKMDEMVKEKAGIHLNELNCQEFYRLQTDLANNKNEITKTLPSLRSGFLPDDYKKQNKTQKKEKDIFTQLLREEQQKRPRDNSSSTMNIFDGI